jgi:hypothetical protein
MLESNEPKSWGSKNTQNMTEELNILPSEKAELPGDYISNNPEFNQIVPQHKEPNYLRGNLFSDYPKNIWESL